MFGKPHLTRPSFRAISVLTAPSLRADAEMLHAQTAFNSNGTTALATVSCDFVTASNDFSDLSRLPSWSACALRKRHAQKLAKRSLWRLVLGVPLQAFHHFFLRYVTSSRLPRSEPPFRGFCVVTQTEVAQSRLTDACTGHVAPKP